MRPGDARRKTMESPKIKALFLDIGGVLLTNGWDRSMRRRAAETFGLDYADMDERHHLTFDTFETGKLTLKEYLARTIFYRDRPFTYDDFTSFMFSQSKPHTDMIEWVRKLKEQFSLKVAVISNEGRELAVYRIHTFGLAEFVDFFVISSFVGLRKPDRDIFRLALDIAQIPPQEAAYIEDRMMFVEVAASAGFNGIHHVGFEPTRDAVRALGLALSASGTEKN